MPNILAVRLELYTWSHKCSQIKAKNKLWALEHHKITCKYLCKDGKLECIRRHYYAGIQDEDHPLDSSASEEECSTDESESDAGEDTV